MISLEDLRSRFQSDSNRALRRLFVQVPTSSHQSEILAYASMIELGLEDGSLSGSEGLALADEVAHLLCDAFDLVSQPDPSHSSAVTLAAALFMAAGFEAKAGTLLTRSRGLDLVRLPLQDSAASLLSYVESAYAALLRKDVDGLRKLAALLQSSDPSPVGHEGRYALVLALLLEDVASYCSSLSSSRPRGTVVRGKCKLLAAIAQAIKSAPLLEASDRIGAVVAETCENSLIATLDAAKIALATEALATFVRGKRAVYTLWPGQKRSIASGALAPDSSFVISLPTSAGKTLLAEIRIAQFLQKYPDKLVIYVAPYNALASQIRRQFDERFSATAIGSATLWTGAFEIDFPLERPDRMLITTPEKLDSIYRQSLLGSEGHADIIRRFGMLIVDEVHMVGLPGRGLALEMLISRFRRAFPALPILALSAVAGNPNELSQWLSGSGNNTATSAWSPTRREVLILKRSGYLETTSGESLLQLRKVTDIASAASEVAMKFVQANAGPVLVFCTQRRYCETIVKRCISTYKERSPDRRLLLCRQLAERIALEYPGEYDLLRKALRHGIAFHHAGVALEIRNELEALVRDSALDIVCATTTLAEGVHLPFRSVLVPYISFVGDEYIDPGLLRNVIGRGGRAYSNVRATVVIVAPKTGPGVTYLKSTLIPALSNPGPVKSQLPVVTSLVTSRNTLANKLRLEDQLLAVAIEPSEAAEDPHRRAYSTSLGRLQSPVSKNVDRFAERFYSEMLSAEAGFLSRNSPLVLTEFGKVAALSGLSARSMLLMRDYLRELALGASNWFEVSAWLEPELPESIRSVISDLSVMAYEYIDHCVTKSRFHERDLSGKIDSEGFIALREATNADRAMILQWMNGDAVADTWDTLKRVRVTWPRAALRSDDEGEGWLSEMINQHKDARLWILSGGLRLSKLICQERNVAAPAFNEALACLEHGVPSARAASLVRFGVDRSLATKFCRWLCEDRPAKFDQPFRFRALAAIDALDFHEVFTSLEVDKLRAALVRS